MHMADALLSPGVGGGIWAVSGALIAYSAKKVRQEADDRKVPLMGVLGAFIFAAQMINFTIPGTGSSGHLGGGMILAILLGPYAAFLTLASVLTVQALFFADGGLLALGCNILNMGFFTCFAAYPLVYRLIAGNAPDKRRMALAATLAAIIGLQLGAFAVVLETLASGVSELPFRTFLLLMLPIHLAIGFVEGLVTAGLAAFVMRTRPEILSSAARRAPLGAGVKGTVLALGIAAAAIAGALSWFASTSPDGLEWAMLRTSGREELESGEELHARLSAVQGRTAFMPDYSFKGPEGAEEGPEASWPSVDAGTSAAGLIGGALTLAVAFLTGWLLRKRGKNAGGSGAL